MEAFRAKCNEVNERFRERPSPITSFRIQLRKLHSGSSLQLFLQNCQVSGEIIGDFLLSSIN